MYCGRRLERAVDEHERRRSSGTAAGSRRTARRAPASCPERRGYARPSSARRLVTTTWRRVQVAASRGPRAARDERVGDGRAPVRVIGAPRRVASSAASGLGIAELAPGRSASAGGRRHRRSRGSSSSNPRPTSSTNTSSSVGSDLWRARMWLPSSPSAATTPPRAPSSTRTGSRHGLAVPGAGVVARRAPRDTTPGQRASAAGRRRAGRARGGRSTRAGPAA